MNNYGKLAYTGIPTLTIGGVVINQWGLLAIAAGMVITGAVLIRFAWRRKKGVNEQ